MQLIPEGPEIPEELLNAHIEGRVVLFCGAGISVPAGYPMFGKLTKQVLEKIPVSDTEQIEKAIASWDYDFALTLLQKKVGLDSFVVREAVSDILRQRPNTLRNHRTILSLSKNHSDQTRLVTTNFDRLFIKADKSIACDSAPKLPIPRPDRWDSVVYLHGLLKKPGKPLDLNELVLTSADFGEAYITDSFCSRFIVELLRHFTVIFIGYSLEDKVMRYLLDAISLSDRINQTKNINTQFNRSYAFISHHEENKESEEKNWESKGVIPIPYFVEKKKATRPKGHNRLYDTLEAWVALFEGGQQERIAIALNEAKKPYIPEDYFTQNRLLWALQGKTGKSAEALFNVDSKYETAKIEWLEFFAENGLLDKTSDKSGEVSGYQQTVTSAPFAPNLHATTRNLILWMNWHLNEFALANWVVENGGVPHPEFCDFYRNPKKPDKFVIQLTEEQKIFWDLLTSQSYRTSQTRSSAIPYVLEPTLDFNDLVVRKEFGELIATRLLIKRNFFDENNNDADFLNKFDFELALKAYRADGLIENILEQPEKYDGLEHLCELASNSLLTGMNWLKSVKKASEHFDYLSYKVSSISEHGQNQFTGELGHLIFLIRDSFIKLFSVDRQMAIQLAMRWSRIEFPIFKRLFFFAATIIGFDLNERAMECLLENKGALVWSSFTKREVSVYLRTEVPKWRSGNIEKLFGTIAKGPERANYKEMSNDEWEQTVDRLKSQKVKKLIQGGILIPESFQSELQLLAESFPSPLPDDQSDEFVFFSHPAEWGHDFPEDVGFQEAYALFKSKTTFEKIDEWNAETDLGPLKQLISDDPSFCFEIADIAIEKQFFDVAFWKANLETLYHLALANKEQMSLADLQENSARLVTNLPAEVLSQPELHHSVASIFEKCHRQIDEEQFLRIWDKTWLAIVEAEAEPYEGSSAINFAINQPSGTMVGVLLSRLWPKNAKIDSGIPYELGSRIQTIISRTDHSSPDTSSIIIASRANNIHSLEKNFFYERIAHIFRWDNIASAAQYWDAFLWASRINPDLFKAIENDFYIALGKESELSEEAYKMLNQMTFIASVSYGAVSENQTRKILDDASRIQLEIISSLIRERTLNAKNEAGDYWKKSIMPWMNKYWPRDIASKTGEVSDNLVMSAIYSGEYFPVLFNWLNDNDLILASPEHTSLVYALHKADWDTKRNYNEAENLPEKFPKEVLKLLWKTRPTRLRFGMLRQIVDRVVAEDSSLLGSIEYRELSALL